MPLGMQQPLVTINNHEKWEPEIANLLREVLEVENQLSWGYVPEKTQYLFPLFNLEYEPVQTAVETKTQRAKEPDLQFKPQALKTTEMSRFSETGTLMTEVENPDWVTIKYAAKQLKMFLKEKDAQVAKTWPLRRIEEFIDQKLTEGGYDRSFLSKENLLLLQHSFGPMFRGLNEANPRMSQKPKNVVMVNLSMMPRQAVSESSLKQHGTVYYSDGSEAGLSSHERNLWRQYLVVKEQAAKYGESALSDDAKAISQRLEFVDSRKLKTPWNLNYASYDPESILRSAHRERGPAGVLCPYARPWVLQLPVLLQTGACGQDARQKRELQPGFLHSTEGLARYPRRRNQR